MSDDMLAQATRELREVSQKAYPGAGFTRARILTSAAKRWHRKSLWRSWRWLLPVMGVWLIGTVALATVPPNGPVFDATGALTNHWHRVPLRAWSLDQGV